MNDYGILSLAPPVLSVLLALYTRNVIVSLGIGAFVGSLILAGMNPFVGTIILVEEHIFAQISVGSNTQVLAVMLIIGGFVKLLEKSGGASALAKAVGGYISSAKKAQLAAWGAGLSVFFTDSGNALIVGPLFRPVFRRLRICKEKLAYIIDTTASPVSILVPITGWGVYIVSLIENSFQAIGLTRDPFEMLLTVWPFQFYAILALLSIPMIVLSGRDVGPMATAQATYFKATGGNAPDDSTGLDPNDSDNIKARPTLFIISLSTLFVSMIAFFVYFASSEGVHGVHIRSGIFVSYILASIACAFVLFRQQKIGYGESLEHFVEGMGKLVFICIVLVLAWSLSSICKELNTGEFLASLLDGKISPHFFPVVFFLLGAAMSFATGSSYGTFAILMIVALPAASMAGASLHLSIAGILCGGLFGDHTSPISDTTVLASMGADCGHIEHVTTQLMYALFVGLLTAIALVVAGLYESPTVVLWMIAVQFISIQALARLFGRRHG